MFVGKLRIVIRTLLKLKVQTVLMAMKTLRMNGIKFLKRIVKIMVNNKIEKSKE